MELRRNNVRVRVIGDWESLPAAPRAALADLQAGPASNTGLLLNLAVNYSSHAELERAVRAIARDVARGRPLPESDRRNGHRPLPLYRRSSRARSPDPPGRRTPPFELLALPGRLCRTGDDRRLLAGFFEGRFRTSADRVSTAGTALRRDLTERRVVVGLIVAAIGLSCVFFPWTFYALLLVIGLCEHLRVQLSLRDQRAAAGVSGRGAGRRCVRGDGGLRRAAQMGGRAAGGNRDRRVRDRHVRGGERAILPAPPTRCSRFSTSASC